MKGQIYIKEKFLEFLKEKNITDVTVENNTIYLSQIGKACNFIPVINKHRIYKFDNTEEYEIICHHLMDDRKPCQINVTKKDFKTSKWFDLLDIGFNYFLSKASEKKELIALFEEFNSHIEFHTEYVYKQLGWQQTIIDNQPYDSYLYHDGSINSLPKNTTVIADARSNDLTKYSLSTPQTEKDIRASAMASKKLLEILPKNLIHPLLGFTYLTPTYTLLNNLDTTINPSFSLFLFGKTEYGKTTLSSIMLSHFGKDFSPKSPPASFDDTMHSVIERFSNLSDAPFWIDDFYPTKDYRKESQMKAILDTLIRNAGNRTNKHRLDKDIQCIDINDIKSFPLITGEYIYQNMPESTLNRCFILEITEKLPPEAFTLAYKTKPDFSYGMHGYIKWLLANKTALPTLWRKSEELVSNFFNDNNRFVQYSIAIYFGFLCMLEYWKSIKVITSKEFSLLTKEHLQILASIYNQNQALLNTLSPTAFFCKALKRIIANSEPTPVSPKGTKGNDNTLLWEDDHSYYIPSSNIKNIIESEKIPHTSQTIYKHLKDDKVIIQQGHDEVARKITLYPGFSQKTITINKEALEAY